MTKRRIILTEDERDLVRVMNHVKTELRIATMVNKETGRSIDLARVMDLLNVKDMILHSLLARVEETK